MYVEPRQRFRVFRLSRWVSNGLPTDRLWTHAKNLNFAKHEPFVFAFVAFCVISTTEPSGRLERRSCSRSYTWS